MFVLVTSRGVKELTSCSSTKGGPSAISSALVPGRILRAAPVSILLIPGNLAPCSSKSDTPGEVGPIWSSAIGGGDGSRGDDVGDCAEAILWSRAHKTHTQTLEFLTPTRFPVLFTDAVRVRDCADKYQRQMCSRRRDRAFWEGQRVAPKNLQLGRRP